MGNKKVNDISNKKRKIVIVGVGDLLHTQVKNICGNIGTSMSDFVKNKLADTVHTYPEQYKKPLE